MARVELVERYGALAGITSVVDTEKIASTVAEAHEGVRMLLGMAMSGDGVEALTGISYLLETEAMHALFASVEGVEVLAVVLQESLDSEECAVATDCLVKLVNNRQMHAVILAAGCVPLLVKRLQDSLGEEREKATEVLAKLLENKESHSTMLAAGAVNALLKHSQGRSCLSAPTRQDGCGYATSPLPPGSTSTRAQMVPYGAPASVPDNNEIIFSKLKDKTSKFLSEIVEYADKSVELIVIAGGEPLLKLFLRVGSPVEKERVLSVLSKMAERWGYNASSLSRYIPQLIDLVTDANSGVRVSAALVLGDLVKSDLRHHKAIGKSDVIPSLVSLLSSTQGGEQRKVLSVIVNLSSFGDNVAVFADVGAMPVLLKIIQESHGDIKKCAATVIDNLTGCPQGLVAVARAGGAPIYLERLSSAEGLRRFNIVLTLNRLIECTEAVEVIGSELLLAISIALIRHSECYQAGSAAKHLAKLAENPDALQVIADAGIITTLVRLSHEYLTKESASKVLQLLAISAEVQRFKRARLASESR